MFLGWREEDKKVTVTGCGQVPSEPGEGLALES